MSHPDRNPTPEECFQHAADALLDAERTINNAGAATYANDIVHATVAIAHGWTLLGDRIARAPQLLEPVEHPGVSTALHVPPSNDPDNAWPGPQHGNTVPSGTVFRAPVQTPATHDWELGESPQRCRKCWLTFDQVVDGEPCDEQGTKRDQRLVR